MNIELNRPLDDRIVIFGMSCVGKTTFAQLLTNHHYYCFDALFQWHLIETFGLSIESNFEHIKSTCTEPRCVIDGWHLADLTGEHLPKGSVVYVVFASYLHIIDQYRVPVADPFQHVSMFNRWYRHVNYELLPGTRYFRNEGNFIECTHEDFTAFLNVDMY